jgi:hypothetical protein
MEDLNLLESTLVSLIIENHAVRYPEFVFHIPLLKIKNREFTGVGSYSNFLYSKKIQIDNVIDTEISCNKLLIVPCFKNELSYVLAITNGMINYLEIVTNGNEEWDGDIEGFQIG